MIDWSIVYSVIIGCAIYDVAKSIIQLIFMIKELADKEQSE